MKLANIPRITFNRAHLFSVCIFVSLLLSFSVLLHAQQPQLNLADIVIALRSKKVTLAERNTLLTAAVKQRGVTFTLSADIEKELAATGADKTLLDAIRQKSSLVKTTATPPPVPVASPTPAPTPAPPDYSFFQKRADTNLGKGEFTLALADYNKAVELKPDAAIAFLNRGKTHYNLKSFDKAVADFDKSIELDPKGSLAFLNRGISQERLGNSKKAIADYQKAVALDAGNENAKANLKRLQDEEAKIAAKSLPPAPVPVPEPVKPPESINLGNLTITNATRMVTPVYSPVAQRSNIEGRVTVDVELDEKGNVVSAKAASGNGLLRASAEDAARKSKFKPALYNNAPIKATGSITYNFSLKPR